VRVPPLAFEAPAMAELPSSSLEKFPTAVDAQQQSCVEGDPAADTESAESTESTGEGSCELDSCSTFTGEALAPSPSQGLSPVYAAVPMAFVPAGTIGMMPFGDAAGIAMCCFLQPQETPLGMGVTSQDLVYQATSLEITAAQTKALARVRMAAERHERIKMQAPWRRKQSEEMPEAPKGGEGMTTPSPTMWWGAPAFAVVTPAFQQEEQDARHRDEGFGRSTKTCEVENEPTTIMLRNLPNDYNRDLLCELLDEEGFSGRYDFVYLPMDFQRWAGFGYAFVNMRDHEAALDAWKHLSGFSEWKVVGSNKICEVCWGSPLQGLVAHRERYRNSPVMHPDVPDHFKPALFEDGQCIPFPAPTQRIRPPRTRRPPRGMPSPANVA